MGSFTMKGCVNELSPCRQPPIVTSVTQDEEDESSSDSTQEYDAELFLRLYENMIQTQEKENHATLAHLRPMLKVLETSGDGEDDMSIFDDEFNMSKEIHYSALKTAVETIEKEPKYSFMKNDIQWNMVLTMLVNQTENQDYYISWAEIVQCYKACVSAMQTLQQIPFAGDIRTRARERSLSIVSTFRQAPNTAERKRSLSYIHGEKELRKQTIALHFVVVFFLAASLLASIFFSYQGSAPSPTLSSALSASQTPQKRSPIFLSTKGADFIANPLIPGPHVSPYASSTLGPIRSIQISRAIPASISRESIPPASAPPILELLVDSPVVVEDIPLSDLPLCKESDTTESTETDIRIASSVSFAPITKDETHENKLAVFRKNRVGIAIGGAATVGVLGRAVAQVLAATSSGVPALLPVGITVFAGTLLANGVRDLIENFLKKKTRRSHRL